MEFKFRAIDERASTHRTPSSFGYFAEQALRAGYSGPDLGRDMEFFPSPNHALEAIQREREKEKIREEIIEAEIARRRCLEAEVRRELLLEREMALGRHGGFSLFSGFGSASSTRFEPRLSPFHQFEDRSLEERLALSLEERLAYRPRWGIGGFATFPFQYNAEPKISEVKPPSGVSKHRVIFLAKPEESFSGAKRKMVTPAAAGASELPSTSLKKKRKEEWSCALCQVSSTSERGLNDHLQGRKHKAKEAALRATRTGKDYAIGLLPKKTGKTTKLPAETSDNKNSEQGEKIRKDLLQINRLEEALLEKKPDGDDASPNKHLAQQAIQGSNNSRRKNVSAKKLKRTMDYKKRRFKFWCEMCQIGVHTEKVMDSHKIGKKHVRRLQELKQNGEFIPAVQVEDACQGKGPEMVAEDVEDEIPDNIGSTGGAVAVVAAEETHEG